MAAEAIAPISVTRGKCGRSASAGDRTTLGEVVTDAIVACLVQRRAPLPEIGHHAQVDVGTVLDQIGHGLYIAGACSVISGVSSKATMRLTSAPASTRRSTTGR